MTNKLLIALVIGISFMSGSLAGKYSANTNWQAKVDKQTVEYNKKYTTELAKNALLTESYQLVKVQLNQNLEEKNRAIQENKTLIDTNNRITNQFMQYFKSTESRSKLQENDQSTIVDPNGVVSSADFLVWAVGLQTHDNQCVNQLNSLIKQIN